MTKGNFLSDLVQRSLISSKGVKLPRASKLRGSLAHSHATALSPALVQPAGSGDVLCFPSRMPRPCLLQGSTPSVALLCPFLPNPHFCEFFDSISQGLHLMHIPFLGHSLSIEIVCGCSATECRSCARHFLQAPLASFLSFLTRGQAERNLAKLLFHNGVTCLFVYLFFSFSFSLGPSLKLLG